MSGRRTSRYTASCTTSSTGGSSAQGAGGNANPPGSTGGGATGGGTGRPAGGGVGGNTGGGGGGAGGGGGIAGGNPPHTPHNTNSDLIHCLDNVLNLTSHQRDVFIANGYEQAMDFIGWKYDAIQKWTTSMTSLAINCAGATYGDQKVKCIQALAHWINPPS